MGGGDRALLLEWTRGRALFDKYGFLPEILTFYDYFNDLAKESLQLQGIMNERKTDSFPLESSLKSHPLWLPLYIGQYIPLYIGQYIPLYIGQYIPLYIGQHIPLYIGQYIPLYIVQYIPLYIVQYIPLYIGQYIPLYIGQYIPLYIGQ